MEPLYRRTFEVSYFEKDEKTWLLESHLVDSTHDIMLTLDVCVPEMVIQDAKIVFNRFPLAECLAIEQKAGQLKGIRILEEYRSRVLPLFMGSDGCPNVMTLLGVSTPGIAYFYFPHLLNKGQMSQEEWWGMVKSRFADDCLAHKLCIQKEIEKGK